jgi:hypothetical protein
MSAMGTTARKPLKEVPHWREIADRMMLEEQRAKEDRARERPAGEQSTGEQPRTSGNHDRQSNLAQAPTVPPSGELRWIVPGFVGEGLTILAGREKVGKTWAALDFAVAVASGGRALDSIACEQGLVTYIDCENGYRRLQARLDRRAPGGTYKEGGGGRDDMPNLRWYHGDLNDNLATQFEEWRRARADLRLIVFDAGKRLARVAGGWTDRATRAALIARIERVQSWAVKHGVAVLCHVHMPKRGLDPAIAHLFRIADAVLVLERQGNRATLKLLSRDTAERIAALAFDAGRFALIGEAQEVHYSLQRSRIVEAMEAVREPIGPSEVAGVLGLPVANVTKMMFRMARAGELERSRRGRYALPGAGKESAIWRSGMSGNGDSAVTTVS